MPFLPHARRWVARRACPAALALALATPWSAAGTSPDPQTAGEAAFEQGDLAQALVQWSLALRAATDAGDDALRFDLLLRLAAVHRELGRLPAAGDLLGQAEGIADAPLHTARLRTATGLLALTAGDARRAERLLREGFELHRAAEDPQGAGNAAVDLGLARRALGQTAEAHKAYTAAATLFEALGDRDGQADALTNRGGLRRATGHLRDAQDDLGRAVELYRATGNVAGEGDALTNLGLVLQDLGQDQRAEELYRAALATARDRKDVARQATLLVALGTLAQAGGDVIAAAEHYRAAEDAFVSIGREDQAAFAALDRASLGPGDPDAMAALVERGRRNEDRRLEAMAALDLGALLRESDPDQAARRAARAEKLAEALELPGVRWRALYLQARLDLDAGREDAGVDRLRQAVDLLEQSRRGLGDADAHGFVTGHAEVYWALIDTLLRQGDSLGAFVYAERLQLRELPVDVAADADAARYRELAEQRDWLQGELSAELVRGEAEPTARAEELRAKLARARIAFAEHVDRLRAGHPHFDELVRVDPEDLEAVQGTLPAGVVVLQPIVLPDRLELLVFRRDGLASYRVDVPAADVERAAGRLTRSLRAADTFDRAWTDELCTQLGGWLVAPLEAELTEASVLVVSASGALRQLPFGLLRHDGRYLADRVAVVGVTHVGSLRDRGAERARFRVDGPGLLLLGNPDGTLPGAEDEIRAIAGLFPEAASLVGPEGTRAALEREANGRTALHLATHGVIDAARPDRSHLVLAPDGGGEGRLSYREIPGLAPYLDGARLVVLSACESSLAVEAGEPADNGDVAISINGLAAQFRRAGVETLVGTLWKVDDEATRELMVHFYGQLDRGTDIGRALQTAQQHMIDDERWSHPYFWAGFVAVGDWR